MNVDIELLGLQNDTIQSYADRLQMRLVDQPIFATHLRAMEIVGDAVELVFDAIPQEYLEPLRQVIGSNEPVEMFAFEIKGEPGQHATGVRVKPRGLRVEKDQALVDIGVEKKATDPKEEETDDEPKGLGLVVEPTATEVVERLLEEEVPAGKSRFFLIIECLAKGFGKVVSAQELVPQTFQSAGAAWGKFVAHASSYNYVIEGIDEELLAKPAGRQTVGVKLGPTGEPMGEIAFAWNPRGNGTEVDLNYRHFADGPAANPGQS